VKRLRRFLLLSSGEQRLLLKTVLLLGAVKLCLLALPFETLRRLLAGFSRTPARSGTFCESSLEAVVWAVDTAGRCVPRAATCLTLALTGQTLLLRRGHEAVVRIGVAKEDGERFVAHAWVESEGRIVIGGYETERYVQLASLEGKGT
jgi:hypothetical protein